MGNSTIKYVTLRLWLFFMQILDFTCSFLEMHVAKILAFCIMILCCVMVNALHLVIVIIILFPTLFGVLAIQVSFCFIGPLLGIIYLSKMVYETHFVPHSTEIRVCEDMNPSFHSALENTILDPEWWGFVEIPDGENLVSHTKYYIIVFFVMTLKAVIELRQRIRRLDVGEPPDAPHVMFPEIIRTDADKNLINFIKYMINYGFYKLGIEITLTFCAFTVALRLDIFSVVYAFWIVLLFSMKRSTMAIVWPFFLITVLVSILWQYVMALGFSQNTCYIYPWDDAKRIAEWCFLPTSKVHPNMKKTLVDYALLLLIQRQVAVFELEKRYGDNYLGGSNKEIYMNYDETYFVNPTPDHTGSIKSWLDFVKYVFLTCLFKITLAILFWTGASNANILSLGYLVGAFVFLWIDYDLCLWNTRRIIKWWNILLGYTVSVVFINSVLELPRCAYSNFFHKNAYWLVELLFLHCEKHGVERHEFTVEHTNMFWDVACFGLILFQRKYFQSYYFLHQKDDALTVFRLQAKGAKLMDHLQETKLKDFQMKERDTLMKIKKKMKRIKAWQKRMQGLNYTEPRDHAEAIYMGDYLMFTDEIKSRSPSSSSEEEREKSRVFDQTMSQFFGTVLKGLGDEKVRPRRKSRAKKTDKSSEGRKIEEEEDTINVEPRDDSEESVQTISKKGKIKNCWHLYCNFIKSVMVSLIRFFNLHSRDYRVIESMMKEERKQQKGLRADSDSTETTSKRRPSKTDPKGPPHSKSKDRKARGAEKPEERGSKDDKKTGEEEKKDDDGEEDRSRKSLQKLTVMLLDAICMFIMSKTELLCFGIIFLHTVISPSLLSVPLPLLVFLWGSLTTVRPTTTFWTVLIAYTEITVVIKALFQNTIFPWNTPEKWKSQCPEYPPMFLGIHRDNQFVVGDLFLLLLLFLHRYKLKTLGLWNRTHEEETLLPQNLKVYRVLPSEADLKDLKGNRSLINQRRLFTQASEMILQSVNVAQIATWKCTSRVTARITYWNNKGGTKIRIKEIEGPILVTYEGRRLAPTNIHVSQMPEDNIEGHVVLRVYRNDIQDTRGLIYKLSWLQHFTHVRKFFVQIVVRDWRVSSDFYTAIFIFEFIDFFIVFFGYSTFTEAPHIQTDDYITLVENQVSPMHLITMIFHFLVIIIDRILYLRKSVIGKLILQFVLVIAVHVWMFIIVPISTENPFNKLPVPQAYYVFCCLYFLMSAYQLRVGYPMRVQGHFLCKKYGYLNFYSYRCLQCIPFFNQLRTLLDYLCSHSSLTMTEFIKMESIFQLVFINKCSRRADIYYPSPRGAECPKCDKYTPTVFVLCGMIIVIWLPFIIFALFITVAQSNLPQEASLIITVGNFGKVYETTVTITDIITLSKYQFQKIQNIYKDSRKIWSFLSLFDERDVAVLKFRQEPYEPWLITPQEFDIFNKTMQNTDIPISLYMNWQVERIPRSLIIPKSKGFTEQILDKSDEARKLFAETLVTPDVKILLNDIFPKFIHVTNEGEAKPVPGFMKYPLRNANFTFINRGSTFWWKLQELNDDPEENKLSQLPFYDVNEITIYTFNEKNIPKLLLNVSKKGIIGLYISIVFVLWTVIKRLMWKFPYIMFEDMPNPDPVLNLCQDIYLARESHEFALEEDLYAKLLFLFRSPETMIRVTRLNPQAENPTQQ